MKYSQISENALKLGILSLVSGREKLQKCHAPLEPLRDWPMATLKAIDHRPR
ncbi:hypothetical protein [Moorena producens]|uniref:hypothetical protein n=1 Tax=Moorena producens TaxID=1155739 RepID=UPI003C745061